MNVTTGAQFDYLNNDIKLYFISALFSFSTVTISLFIVIVIWLSKPQLHTKRHLLTCNTCIASIFYCIVQVINQIFLIFLQWETSDTSCKYRAFFSYVTVSAVIYSYFIQALSRLFISFFSLSHFKLITYKAHYYIILVKWLTVFVITLPTIITDDVHYRPKKLCWVPLHCSVHVVYTYLAYYIIPTYLTFVIYVFIYYRMRRTSKLAAIRFRVTNHGKRDLEVLRNIIILLILYLFTGVPSTLFVVTARPVLYSVSIITIPLTLSLEKVATILLDRDMRQVIGKFLKKTEKVIPSSQPDIILTPQAKSEHR
jgi:hypothetical protein